ncbi:MAG: acetoacetate--CoA ligase, partial [bacterium]|nr:acetoacetate--CoA ligase [bacterium]
MKQDANMTRFIQFVNNRHGLALSDYDELYRWSIDSISDLWTAVWDFTEIKASRSYDLVVDDLDKFPGAEWFPGARLNFAENLLRFRDDHLAFIFKGEDQRSDTM